ncbi:MAG: hypothetical protein V4508_21350 [Pseudomonadota bacterium]
MTATVLNKKDFTAAIGTVAAIIAAALFSGAAIASPITTPTQLAGATTLIDFNTLSQGDYANPITISGVTFSGNLNVKNAQPYYAPVNFPTFVSGMTLGLPSVAGQGQVFTITFANLVSEAGFGIFDPNFAGNVITAYDNAGNVLESTTPDALFPVGGTGADYVGFLRSGVDIRRIEIVAGSRAGVSDGIWIDNLRFDIATPNALPIPGSLILILTGLLVATAVRRVKA